MTDYQVSEFILDLSRTITKSVLGTNEGPIANSIGNEFYSRGMSKKEDIKQLLEEHLLMDKGDPADRILKLILE